MKGIVMEKSDGIQNVLFEDGQVISFDEKALAQAVQVGDVVTLKLAVNKALTEKARKLCRPADKGEE